MEYRLHLTGIGPLQSEIREQHNHVVSLVDGPTKLFAQRHHCRRQAILPPSEQQVDIF
jgi:hypothetical protein